jgi:hypothetical protein
VSGLAVLQRVRRAWPATALVHASKTLLAAAIALPALGSLSNPTLRVDAPTAHWIALLRLGSELPPELPRYAAAPLLAAAILSPLLALAWLAALDRPAPLAEHLRAAARHYGQSATIALLTLLCLAILAAAGVLTISLARRLSSVLDDERASDLASLLLAAPFVMAAVHALCVQDAATAALLRGGTGLRRALRAGFRSATLGLTLVRIACLSLQALAIPASLAFARFAFVGAAGSDMAWLLGQSAALLVTLVRAGWLALVLERRRDP